MIEEAKYAPSLTGRGWHLLSGAVIHNIRGLTPEKRYYFIPLSMNGNYIMDERALRSSYNGNHP